MPGISIKVSLSQRRVIKKRVSVATLGLVASILAGIQLHESFSGTAYMPTPNDVPTIGFGTTEGVKMGDTITRKKAEERLAEELETIYVRGVRKCVKVPVFDYEWAAFVSLTYNIGVGAFCGSTLVKLLNTEDYAGACAQISRWDKQKGKVLRGLTKRRKEERNICEGRA